MNNQEVSTAYVGSTEIKEARLGTQLVLAPGGDALWYKANEIPTLDLRFADNKSLVDATTGTNLVDFTRASTATYVGNDGLIKTATTNAPRFDHNPTTGESLGLLVEESRTNLAKSSQDISTADWVRERGSQSSSSITKPDGSTSSTPVVWTEDTTASATHRIVSTVITGTVADYTFSVFLKAKERTRARVTVWTGSAEKGADVNLATGGITSINSPTSVRITRYPNDWYRVAVVAQFTAASCFGIIYTADNTGNVTYTGDGTSGIYIWGAQLEAGSLPTSYIPTEGTTVTRATDVASISGSNFSSWYNQSEGTILADAYREYAVPVNQFPHVFDARNTGDDIMQIAYNTETIGTGYSRTSAVDQATLFPTNVNGVRRRSQAFAYKTNDFAMSANGGPLFTDNSGTPSNVINQAALGSRVGSSSYQLNGTIRRITFWPQRLSNATLQTITL